MKLHANRFTKIVLILFVLALTNCHKGDDPSSHIEATIKKKKIEQKTGSQLPHVTGFINQLTNGTNKVRLEEAKILPLLDEDLYARESDETPFGLIDNSKIIQVNNENNIKYTVNVKTPQTPGEYVNLIITQNGDVLKESYIKYIPDEDWLDSQDGRIDYSKYTGVMKFYDYEGNLAGETLMDNGVVINNTGSSTPCPDDTDEDPNDNETNEDDNSGDGSTGGGGDADWSDGTTDEGDYDGNSNGGSSGGGGYLEDPDKPPCSVYWMDPDGDTWPYGNLTAEEAATEGLVLVIDCSNRTAMTPNDDPCEGDVGVIIDDGIRNEIENECQKLIVDEAYSVTAPLNSGIHAAFATNQNYDLVYTQDNDMPSTRNAFTSANCSGTSCDFDVKIRTGHLEEATNLAIARTTIHENIHALLLYLHFTGAITTSNSDPDFVALADAYANTLGEEAVSNGAFDDLNDAHHHFMTDLVDDIATTLSAYGASNGYSLPFSYYRKLAWGGLTETSSFTQEHTNDEQREIIAILRAENENNTVEYLTLDGWQEASPKGNPANANSPCEDE